MRVVASSVIPVQTDIEWKGLRLSCAAGAGWLPSVYTID